MNITKIIGMGLALLAGVLVFFLLQNNSDEPAPVQIIKPKKEETVRVLVSRRDITRGERLTAEDTDWITWPKKAVQPHFITDANPEKREELVGAVARTLIVTGETIIDRKVVRAGTAGLMSAILSPGMRAVTMRVSAETSSGGFILPGDRVDIHYTIDGDGDGTSSSVEVLKENVRVLAVDAIYSEETEASNILGNNITLELSPKDAETFLVAKNSRGSMQLTLRSIFESEGEEVVSRDKRKTPQVIRYGRT